MRREQSEMATGPGGAKSVRYAVPRNSGAACKLMKGIIVAREASVNLMRAARSAERCWDTTCTNDKLKRIA
jgi:hypothetical protein